MRVIAGSARRLLLKTIEGMDTRPTTDRIKETLFNMLNTQILDLFAGSGAPLSRLYIFGYHLPEAELLVSRLEPGWCKTGIFLESNPEAVSCMYC